MTSVNNTSKDRKIEKKNKVYYQEIQIAGYFTSQIKLWVELDYYDWCLERFDFVWGKEMDMY